MPWLELFGWFGSVIVIISMMELRLMRLLFINLAGCIAQIFYHIALSVWPMDGPTVVLVIIQIASLYRLLAPRPGDSRDAVVPTRAEDPYLRYLLAHHADDVRDFTPSSTAPMIRNRPLSSCAARTRSGTY
ncbi:MAG: hypothetical protein Q4P36_08315 [Bowdeniella nasicola]|nr:hypothetical protein [Bowdeniella nasicola]